MMVWQARQRSSVFFLPRQELRARIEAKFYLALIEKKQWLALTDIGQQAHKFCVPRHLKARIHTLHGLNSRRQTRRRFGCMFVTTGGGRCSLSQPEDAVHSAHLDLRTRLRVPGT